MHVIMGIIRLRPRKQPFNVNSRLLTDHLDHLARIDRKGGWKCVCGGGGPGRGGGGKSSKCNWRVTGNPIKYGDTPLDQGTSFWLCRTFDCGTVLPPPPPKKILVYLSNTLCNFSETHKTGFFRLGWGGLTPVQQQVWSDCHIQNCGQLSSQ